MLIGWGDVYKVVVAMTPLYVALILGFCSLKWWKMFTREQCDAINRFACYFTLPLYTFQFTAHANPFEWNYRFIIADTISKLIIVLILAVWAKFSSKGSYCWSITSFSLSTLTNSLVVGIPLLKAMYGENGVSIVVQSSVFQGIVWFTILLFILEFRKAGNEVPTTMDENVESPVILSVESSPVKDLERNEKSMVGVTTSVISRPSLSSMIKIVLVKLALNPNAHASILGIIWAFASNRWNFEMPKILEDSILIMSHAGIGSAMFSMGLFMALQEKVLACGPSLTIFGMVLRFIAGPAAMAIGAIAVGLHGNILRVAIIQAALPQSITSFIYAKEYGLHADVFSTAVIFGMLVSLPVLICYFIALGFLN